MYLNLGQTVLPAGEIVGIFDLDNASWAFKTREFLERAEQEGRVITLGDGLPRSFVLCRDGKLYITPLSAGVLKGRMIDRIFPSAYWESPSLALRPDSPL